MGLSLLGIAAGLQLVPYGHGRSNPPVSAEPEWDSPRTQELFARACRDCHSNETRWPWYAALAPSSWLLRWDVDEGRSHWNVSEWDRPEQHGDEAARMLREGEMPPWYYLPWHPEARLSDAERAELETGLVATFGDEGAEPGPEGSRPDQDH